MLKTLAWLKTSALALLLSASGALAQPAPSALTEAQKHEIVDKAAHALAEGYIYPDRGRAAGEAIEKALASGGYSAIDDRVTFASRLTDDLQAVTHDKHMRVRAPGSPPPPGAPKGPPPQTWGGFIRVARLKGNVGYIDLAGFPPAGIFREAANAAMKAVQDTDALIIDMRRNGGGEPEAVAYLCSFLFDGGRPVHLNDLVWRNAGAETYRTETFSTRPVPIHYGKPVILITSHFTFSGGEEFTNDLKVLKRATIVGETTGGGANPGEPEALGSGLMLFVPHGRAENPTTKTNWEGVGVQPDVPTAPGEAFATAYHAALKAAPATPGRQTLMAEADAKNSDVGAWIDAELLTPRTTASPVAEAALRKVIASVSAGGEPDYAALDPGLVDDVRKSMPDVHKEMAGLGALQSLTFKGVDMLGSDTYHAVFEHGEMDWVIYVEADGKIAAVFFPSPPVHRAS